MGEVRGTRTERDSMGPVEVPQEDLRRALDPASMTEPRLRGRED